MFQLARAIAEVVFDFLKLGGVGSTDHCNTAWSLSAGA
jgi:hypothetical protein